MLSPHLTTNTADTNLELASKFLGLSASASVCKTSGFILHLFWTLSYHWYCINQNIIQQLVVQVSFSSLSYGMIRKEQRGEWQYRLFSLSGLLCTFVFNLHHRYICSESIADHFIVRLGLDYSLFAVFFIIIDWQTITMSNNVKSSN